METDSEDAGTEEPVASGEAGETAAPSSGNGPDPLWGRPVLRLVGGELPDTVDATDVLLRAADPELYEFGDAVVRPGPEPIRIADKGEVTGLRLVQVSAVHLVDRLTRIIDFQRYDKRARAWVSVDCPEKVAKTYLARTGLRHLRQLTALSTCPVLRPDGTVLERPGFDEATGILFDPQGRYFPPVPTAPSRATAAAALAELKLPFHEFPFIDQLGSDPDRPNASLSVLLSGLLCTVARLAFPFAPCHAFDAPAAGTGKSKLVDCCAILATGHECPVISQGDDETELEKRLGALLLAGDRTISIDNCDKPLGGQLLCQIITQRLIQVRVLGLSKVVTIPNNTLLFANGNNFKLYGDMLRRGLIGRLDAGVERPELREFTFEDPVVTLKRERGKYVAAALTVLRAYIVADRPEPILPLGGFEGWSQLVREALVWLGEADPVDTLENARIEDPQRQNLEAVLVQWDVVLGRRRVTAKEAIETALILTGTPGGAGGNPFLYPAFRTALMAIAGDSDRLSTGRLGKWLGANKRKVVGDLRIIADGVVDGTARWRMQHRQADGSWR